MVDKAKLDQMLSNLARYVDVLAGLASTPRDEFLGNPDRIGNAKYHFVIAIECCIDIANHVIASENFRFPKDNADSFTSVAEQDLLPPELLERLVLMARFCNRLVHLYWEIDDQRVYAYLQDSLGDLRSFARTIAAQEW